MLNLKDILKKFSFSLVIFFIITVYFLYTENINLIPKFYNFVVKLNVKLYILAGIACSIAAFSAIIPYIPILIKKSKIKNILGNAFALEYFEDLGGKTSDFIVNKFKIKNSETKINAIKSAETISLLIMFFLALSFITSLKTIFFFLIVIVIELIFVIYYIHRNIPNIRKLGLFIFSQSILLALFRFSLEFPRTILTIYSVNIFPNPSLIFCFIATGSLLYYVPKLKRAGGLLELYLVIAFPLLGGTILQGFFTAILFRLNGIIFFMLPMYISTLLKK